MKIVLAPSRKELGAYTASVAAEILRQAIAEQGFATLVVATGSSQFEVLSSLVGQPGIDWSKVDGFHLDEYIGIDRDHAASFCGYLRDRFVSKVPLRSFYYLDGTKSPEQLIADANQAIAPRSIDLALVGIGENSHLAFNDPPADFDSNQPYLKVALDEACRLQQVGEGWFAKLSDVPTHAISMSIRQIMKSKRILCSVPDERKSQAIKASVEGAVTPTVPASILQQHPAVDLVIDLASSSQLSSETLGRAIRLPAA